MKNIFKIMGIAVLACGMMVACSKPEEDNNNNNNNNGGNNNQQQDPYAKVTFGTTEWNAGVAQIYTANYQNFGVNEYILYKEAQAYPFLDAMISGQAGTYQHEATLGQNTEGGYSYYAWQTGESVSEQYLPLYSINYFETQQVNQKGDWQPVSANLTVTNYDATTLTATFKLTATMYDYYSWAADLVTNAEDADTKNLEVNVYNYVFTEISK